MTFDFGYQEALEGLKSFVGTLVDADLTRTLIASAFGTFAGAWIASRTQTKRSIIAELNAIAAADMLAIQIANTHIALKRQHVRPIVASYEQIGRDYEAYRNSRAMQVAKVAFSYSAELKSLSPLRTPIIALEALILEKISLRGRGLAAALELAAAIDVLKLVIENRNLLIDEFKTSQLEDHQKLEIFLGLRTAKGVVDERFKSNVEALLLKTDDCIFFSKILSEDLHRYAARLHKRYRWRFRLKRFLPERADWSSTTLADLLPKEPDYHAWLRGFKSKPSAWRKLLFWRQPAGRISVA